MNVVSFDAISLNRQSDEMINSSCEFKRDSSAWVLWVGRNNAIRSPRRYKFRRPEVSLQFDEAKSQSAFVVFEYNRLHWIGLIFSDEYHGKR